MNQKPQPHDPWTGTEPGIAFPGWNAVASSLVRWRTLPGGPAFLRNGLLAREELLQRDDQPAERKAWYAFEHELFMQAIAGTLDPAQVTL